MRKLIIALLLAGAAATPALADPGDWRSNHESRGGDSRDSRGDRHQSDSNSNSNSNSSQNQSDHASSPVHFSGNRGGHDDSNAGSNQAGSQGSGHRDVSSGGGDHSGGMNWRGQGSFSGRQHDSGGQGDNGGNHNGWQHRVIESGSSGDNTTQDRGNGGARDFWQRRTRVAGSGDQVGSGGLVQPEHPVPHVFRSRTPVISDTPREGTQPRLRTGERRTTSVAWNHNWRHDRKYDWWNWRRTHRSHFHLSFYYDPFGWGYRPYEIGWRLWPSYYSSRYWINDPWEYRLPYAPPGYRWIRYYDDAILIDTWDGQIVDVIYNFFW